MIRGMARKKNRAGVLIFVSLAEHYAPHRCRRWYRFRVHQSVWQDAIDALLERAAQGDCGGHRGREMQQGS